MLAACVLVVALPLNIVNTLILASTRDNPFNLDDGDEPRQQRHRGRGQPGDRCS